MRLLNSATPEIKEFPSEDDIPPYAIVSHRWGKEEVELRDWQLSSGISLEAMTGYRKIEYSRKQAKQEGIDWIWIDTCCIDKTSTAELSEAINSMFRWYQKAQVCYVYLSDVIGTAALPLLGKIGALADGLLPSSEWFKTEWFKRGWTLQELLAPTHLVFYTSDWHELGTKAELCDLVSENTGIEKEFLMGGDLELASVSKKMSWAAGRKTSRTEDIAYCLLGIFDVNMPLIYGEGRKAFTRLQHEIMKILPYDHTLYAWGDIVEQSSIAVSDPETLWGNKFPPWDQEAAERSLRGLLAESPDDFEGSGSFAIHHDAVNMYQGPDMLERPAPSYRGVHIKLPIKPRSIHLGSVYYQKDLRMTQLRPNFLAVLFCKPSSTDPSLLALPLQVWGIGAVGRTRELLKIPHDSPRLWHLQKLKHTFCIEPERHRNLQDGDFIFRRVQYDPHHHKPQFDSHSNVGYIQDEQSWRVEHDIEGRLFLFDFGKPKFWHEEIPYGAFSIVFGRNQTKEVTVEVLPLVRGTSVGSVEINGLDWHSGGNDTIFARSFLSDTKFGRVMARPRDRWALEASPFPRIFVEVEKRQLVDGQGFIDVIDLIIDPPRITRNTGPETEKSVIEAEAQQTTIEAELRDRKSALPRTISLTLTQATRRTKTEAKGTLSKRATRRNSTLIWKSRLPPESVDHIGPSKRTRHPALKVPRRTRRRSDFRRLTISVMKRKDENRS